MRTRVGFALLDIAPVPLTNARTTGIRQNQSTNILKSSHLTVTGDSGTDLLGTRSDRELALGLQTVVVSLTGDRRSAGHVLVRRVRARANECNLELRWPLVLLDGLLELGKRSGKIGGERTVDMGLEVGQVLLACQQEAQQK